MTLVPEIRDQIHATARCRTRSAGVARRQAPRWRRVSGSLMLAASVLVVAGVLAVVIHDVHHITGGAGQAAGHSVSAPPPGWGQLNAKTIARVEQQDAACRPRRLTSAAPFRHDAPGKDLTAAFGVLRHPTPDSQRVSASALRQLPGGRLDQFARGIYLRYVRHGERAGITYYLIPAANVNQLRPIPERCYREQLNAFRQFAALRSTEQRPALIGYETGTLQQQRSIAEHPAGVCLVRAGAGDVGTGPCVNAVALRQFRGGLDVASDGNDHITVTALIVPDRVATVTARYNPQTYPGRVPSPLTVTQPAVDNLVIFALHGAWDPPNSLTYRTVTGAVLWSTSRR